MSNHLNKEIKQFPPTQLEYSGSLKSIILRCLNKEPSQRWNSAAELKSALEVNPVKDNRLKYMYVYGALILVPVLCLLIFSRLQPEPKAVAPVKPQLVSETKINPFMLRLRY